MAAQRELTIKGAFEDGALEIDHVSGLDALSTAFEFTLRLRSENENFDIASIVGDTVTVSFDTEPGPTRYFNGYVTRMVRAGIFDKYCHYEATIRPWFFLMSSRINSRIFQNKSVPDIAKDLFREHGFSDFEDALTGNYGARDFVVQYRESDFTFVSRLFEHAGIYYFFKHEENRHVLVLADSNSAHHSVPGHELVPFHPEGSPTPLAAECINQWQLTHEWRPGAYASNDFDFERPRVNLTAQLQAESKHKKGDLEIFDYPAGHVVQTDVESYVRTRLDAFQFDVEVANGTADVRGLGVGNTFALIDYPNDSENKQYLLAAVSYDAKNTAHEAGETDPGYFRVAFSAVDNKVPYRPRASSPRPRVEGVQTAIVVGPKGEEIWTDEYGRVKVQFHWDREGKDDENSSCWVRVAQVWAGAKWGAMHIPRIGQEVIVDFLEGDPDRPIITGRVYNGDNMPPYDLPDNKTQSGIKSRSTKEGSPKNFNELRFEDKKGSEEVYLQAEKNYEILVKNDEHRIVGHDRTEEVKNDETITIDGNRTETVHKDETITIDGNRTESVKKDETISIDGARTETVAKDESVSVTGARTMSVGKDDSTTVSGKQILTVAKDQNVDVSGVRTINVEKDDTFSVGGKLTVTIGKAEERQVGKSLVIDVADEITIKTGDASISMKKNGDITLKGKNITIDGSGKAILKGDGGAVVKGSKVGNN